MEMRNIESDACERANNGGIGVEIERPKRVIHFSDGTLDESSESDEEQEPARIQEPHNQIIESELQWGPWLFYKATKVGTNVLAGCDYVGESLASFLGITTPKYESEIEEFKRNQVENEKIEKEKTEHASWMEKESLNGTSAIITTEIEKSKIEKF